ncbi:unnamed protein product, partial [Allacma fusca]
NSNHEHEIFGDCLKHLAQSLMRSIEAFVEAGLVEVGGAVVRTRAVGQAVAAWRADTSWGKWVSDLRLRTQKRAGRGGKSRQSP